MGAAQGIFDVFSDPTRAGHAAKRRMLASTYSAVSVGQLESRVQATTDRLIGRFQEFSTSKQPMNLSGWLQWYAFDVIGQVSFSKQFGFLDAGKDVNNTLQTIDDTLWALIMVAEMPELHRLRTSRIFKYIPFLGSIDNNMDFVIGVSINPVLQGATIQITDLATQQAFRNYAERQAAPKSGQQDILSMLLAVQEANPDRFKAIDVQLTLCLNIFAGSDTTSIALRAILYYLIQNPLSCEKLLVELSEATQAGTLSEKNTLAEAQKLPYLQACIKEAMRLHPSLGTQHQRVVPEGGCTVAGIFLPAKVSRPLPIFPRVASQS